MERRGRRPANWDGTIDCRSCKKRIVLERERMSRQDSTWLVTCPHCKETFPVRHTDPDIDLVREIVRRHSEAGGPTP